MHVRPGHRPFPNTLLRLLKQARTQAVDHPDKDKVLSRNFLIQAQLHPRFLVRDFSCVGSPLMPMTSFSGKTMLFHYSSTAPMVLLPQLALASLPKLYLKLDATKFTW